MPVYTDLSFLLMLADESEPGDELARTALDMAFPGGVTDDSPAKLAAEVLRHAGTSGAASPLALTAAALTAPNTTPEWANYAIDPDGLAHLRLLRALVAHTARHLPSTRTPMRLLLAALTEPAHRDTRD